MLVSAVPLNAIATGALCHERCYFNIAVGGSIMPSQAGFYHSTGDFIFCRDGGVVSRLLRLAQRRIDGTPAPYSHAAMCIHPGLFIHSVPGGGVQLLRMEESHPEAISFGEEFRGDVLVLRLPEWPLDPLSLIQAILFWTGQSYNFNFLRPVEGIRGKAYCSQLLLQIMEKAGLVLPDRQAGRPVTPSGLHRLILRLGARDVTCEYHEYARMLIEDPQEFYLLARDMPREMIHRAAEKNLQQAYARRILTHEIGVRGAEAAEAITDVAAQIRLVRGCSRPVDEVVADIGSYLSGAETLLRLIDSACLTPMHHLDLVGTPGVVLSGMLLYPAQLESLSNELQLVSEELAALFDLLEFMNSGRAFPAEQVRNFIGYCERRLQERPAAAAALIRRLHGMPYDFDSLVAQEPALKPLTAVIGGLRMRAEALQNMGTALETLLISSRQLWEGTNLEPDAFTERTGT